jgi:hypothetical protein
MGASNTCAASTPPPSSMPASRWLAQWIGDDPAVLLRNCAKRKRSNEANASLASAIEALASTFLGN